MCVEHTTSVGNLGAVQQSCSQTGGFWNSSQCPRTAAVGICTTDEQLAVFYQGAEADLRTTCELVQKGTFESLMVEGRCSDGWQAIREKAQEIEATMNACTKDEECALAGISTRCFGICDGAAVTAGREQEFSSAVFEFGKTICTDAFVDKCSMNELPCNGAKVMCGDGTCKRYN
jgi:hypothetical protein